jgi:hypothetical protein
MIVTDIMIPVVAMMIMRIKFPVNTGNAVETSHAIDRSLGFPPNPNDV